MPSGILKKKKWKQQKLKKQGKGKRNNPSSLYKKTGKEFSFPVFLDIYQFYFFIPML
jgi:hypothetical protein